MKAYEKLRQTTDQCSEETLDQMGVPEEARQAFKLGMGRHILDGAHGLWYPAEDNIEGHKPEELAVTIGQRLHALAMLYNGPALGSPIEDRMAGALLWLDIDWACFPEADLVGGPADHIELWGPRDELSFYITPQARIGRFKADFLLWFSMGRHHGGVIVECDGHQFHERNKEQAARDKSRDRELLSAGYPVMRFTGSEIFKDPVGCAEQVRDPLSTVLFRVSKDGGLF
jgi:very-short-patch-repair endonuclease